MKRLLIVMVVLSSVVIANIAQSDSHVDGASLWERIAVQSSYKDWGQFPDHMGMQTGAAPHGAKHIVYVNTQGLTKGHPKPYGTVIVKENYTPDEKLAAITVMYKVEGYNPKAGDWFWVKYGPDGAVHKEGKPTGCINCHSGRATRDFIMVSSH